ncbi:hypothetical protein D3C81_1773490 [compost metagenome]
MHQRLQQRVPVVVHGFAQRLRRIEQLLDLADGHPTVEPGNNGLDTLHMFGREQAVPLGCALRHDEAVAPFPGS